MDIIWPLILMLVIYLVPELLKKRRNPKDYKYPEVPPCPEDKSFTENNEVCETFVKHTTLDENTAYQLNQQAIQLTVVKAEPQPWDGQLDNNLIVNGFIFSQILEPPRAYNPLWRKRH